MGDVSETTPEPSLQEDALTTQTQSVGSASCKNYAAQEETYFIDEEKSVPTASTSCRQSLEVGVALDSLISLIQPVDAISRDGSD